MSHHTSRTINMKMQMHRIFYVFLLLCNYRLVNGVPLAAIETAAQTQQLQSQQQQQQQQQQNQLDAIKYEGNDNRVIKETTTSHTQQNSANIASSFNPPRVEYNTNNNNEWRPLGHGDPLKNDPTFDYSPPALERVRYWASSDDKHDGERDRDRDRDAGGDGELKRDKTDTETLKQGKKINAAGISNGNGLKQSPIDDAAAIYALKNARNEVPLLQPKYNTNTVRRNYGTYAATASAPAALNNPMPAPMTHLMPPPMLKPAAANAAKTYWQQQAQAQAQVQPQPQPQAHQSLQHQPQPHQPLQHPSQYHHTAAPSMAMSRVSMAGGAHHEQPPSHHDHHNAHYHDYYDHTPHYHHNQPASPAAYQKSQQQQMHPHPHPYHQHSQTEATHHYYAHTRPATYHTSGTGTTSSSSSSSSKGATNNVPGHYAPSAYSPNAIHMTEQAYHKTSTTGAGATAVTSRKPWLHELLQKEVVVVKSTPAPFSIVTQAAPAKYASSMASNYHHQQQQQLHHHQPYHHPPTSHNTHTITYVTTPSTYHHNYNYNAAKVTTMPFMSSASIYVTPAPVQSPPFTSMPPTMTTTTATTMARPTTMATTTTTTTKSTPTLTSTTLRTTAVPSQPPPPTSAPAPTYAPTTTSTTTTTTTSRLLIPNTSNLQHRPTVAPMVPITTNDHYSHYKQPEKPWRGAGGHMYLIIEGHSKVKKYGKNEIDYHQPKIVPVIPKREPVLRVARPDETTRGTPETFNVKHLHTKTSTTTTTTTTTTTPMPTTTRATIKPAATTAKAPITTTTTTTTTTKPTTTNKPKLVKEAGNDVAMPPTAMSGLLSLLDNMLRDEESIVGPTPIAPATTTKLKPVLTTVKPSAKPALALDARISGQAADIAAEVEANDATRDKLQAMPPAEFRQVFDYDQLPESRIKQQQQQQQLLSHGALDEYAAYDDEDDAEFGEVEDVMMQEDGDSPQRIIKRIDKLVNDDAEEADISLPLDDLTDGEDDDGDDDDDDDDGVGVGDDEEAEAAAEAEVLEDLNIAIGRSNANKST